MLGGSWEIMKLKLGIVLIGILAVISLAGCGGNSKSKTSAQAAKSAASSKKASEKLKERHQASQKARQKSIASQKSAASLSSTQKASLAIAESSKRSSELSSQQAASAEAARKSEAVKTASQPSTSSQVSAPVQPVTPPKVVQPASTGIAAFVAKSPSARYSDQIVGVVASGSYAQVYLFEKTNSVWQQILSSSGRVGYQGVGTAQEGSGRTPRGSYGLTLAFGTGGNPGSGLPYRQITSRSYWISNTADAQYNTWQERDQSSTLDEHLSHYPTQYRYAIALNYSNGVGGGSAFFLHCNGAGSTAGCISVPASVMLQLIRRIHSGARIINVTSNAQLASY